MKSGIIQVEPENPVSGRDKILISLREWSHSNQIYYDVSVYQK
jgi:hypothetical protein